MPKLVIDIGPGDAGRATATRMKQGFEERGLDAHVEGGENDTRLVIDFPYDREGRESAIALKMQLSQIGLDARLESDSEKGWGDCFERRPRGSIRYSRNIQGTSIWRLVLLHDVQPEAGGQIPPPGGYQHPCYDHGRRCHRKPSEGKTGDFSRADDGRRNFHPFYRRGSRLLRHLSGGTSE